ncbi:MAG TPA: hypothetical protein VM370_13375 [Candidatus Thermoplasmatota archaeon]|nr:hypothetical protein [Candidatus Thermoplasmatota archaeon]
MNTNRARYACLIALLLVGSLAAFGTAAAAKDDNRGTIKVHDDETADPEVRNEPHVSCDFWIEGFNMKDPDGYLVFYSWPPTGDKSEVTPTGDGLDWTGTADGDGEYDFLNGAYQLPAGHYRVEAYTNDGHPGGDGSHFAKAKMFWVDPCETECQEDCNPCTVDCNPCTEDCTPPPCSEDVPADECEEVPFFPGAAPLALGILGSVAIAGSVMYRKRRS